MALGTNAQLLSHLGRHSVRGHWRHGKDCHEVLQCADFLYERAYPGRC